MTECGVDERADTLSRVATPQASESDINGSHLCESIIEGESCKIAPEHVVALCRRLESSNERRIWDS